MKFSIRDFFSKCDKIVENCDKTAWKLSKTEIFSGPYFPIFGLNTEIYGVNIFRPNIGKYGPEKTPFFRHFSCSDFIIDVWQGPKYTSALYCMKFHQCLAHFQLYRSSHCRFSIKKVFVKILQETLVPKSFLNNNAGLILQLC